MTFPTSSPYVNAMLEQYQFGSPETRLNAMLAQYSAPPVPFALNALAGEVPEADRPRVAWVNIAGDWSVSVARDRFGHLLYRDDHGKDRPTGWHVDHVVPLCAGGTSVASNLQARQGRHNMLAGSALSALLRSSR